MYTQEAKSSYFQRRTDLTNQKRMLIAYLVLYQYSWGLISRLSGKYNVSRQFIYNLRDEFSDLNPLPIISKADLGRKGSIQAALSLRLEGKSSIESISTLMKRQGYSHSSVGFISQILKEVGQSIGNSLNISKTLGTQFIFCCDEVFAKQSAILITVDPISLMILSIELAENRKGESWESHWKSLIAQGCKPLYIAKDEGLGMKLAKSEVFPEIASQSDTFHAVAHRLGLWSERLQRGAFKSINQEYESLRLLEVAKSEDILIKRKKSTNRTAYSQSKPLNCTKILNFYTIAC
jgi:hypothetical protein